MKSENGTPSAAPPPSSQPASAVPGWQNDLPEGMIIPAESFARIPELNHFETRAYRERDKEYNSGQLKYFNSGGGYECFCIRSFDPESITGDRCIGKFIIAYQDESILLSVAYDESSMTEDDEDYRMKNGIHQYDYNESVDEELVKDVIGDQIALENYSSCSGKWINYRPTAYENKEDSYLLVETGSDGSIIGEMQLMSLEKKEHLQIS